MNTQPINPMILADECLAMAREYEKLSDELVEIKVKKATEIVYLRAKENVKSDVQAERIWQTTENGISEMRLTFKLKSLEKLMSAIKKKLEVLNAQTNYNKY